ncbi:unnamed protein product, partial [Rotaria sp. Silwood1]
MIIQELHIELPYVIRRIFDSSLCDIDNDCITSVDLQRHDSSIMYIQLLKEVLLQMEVDDKAKKELFQFCRKTNIGILGRMNIIGEFERYYHMHTPMWWYTRESFIHDMINRVLRLQDIDAIIQTRFFIQDLHQQIERLYEPPSKKLTLYRGQGLS